MHAEDIYVQGRTDTLTGLPNRQAFFERLKFQVVSGEPYSLLFVDIDKFKSINDTYGHEAGDHVLVQTGQRILSCIRQAKITMPGGIEQPSNVRETDLAARYGGEEIVVLLSGVNSTDETEIVGNRIVDVFRQSEMAIDDNRTITVTASVGGAIAGYGGINESAIEVLKRADQNLYRAKHSGRNQFIGETPIVIQPVA